MKVCLDRACHAQLVQVDCGTCIASILPKLGRSLGTRLGLACVCDMPTEGDTVHVDDVHDHMELIASSCECMGAMPNDRRGVIIGIYYTRTSNLQQCAK